VEFPCQGASLSGRSKNKIKYAEEHPKVGELFVHLIKIIEKSNPFAVLIENVPEYLSTISMTVIRNVLDRLGYSINETIVDNQMGSFEQRKRMCLLGITKGFDFDFAQLQPSRERENTLGEMLDDIPLDSPMWSEMTYIFEKEKRDLAAGKGFKTQIKDGSATSIGCISAGYAKIRSTELKILHPTNPQLFRLVTVEEHARVKSVPSHLIKDIPSVTLGHHILGNSVIHAAFVSVGQLLGSQIRQWFNLNSIKLVHPSTLKVEHVTPEPNQGLQFDLFSMESAA
jgi:DNA (cytosine-5)-methyltransferase 1